MIIGVVKEIMLGEGRVAATPETVAMYCADGWRVLVENGAGKGAHFTDDDYGLAGAELVNDAAEVYRQADLILKVKEPLWDQQRGQHELEMMHAGQCLITFLHPASPVNHEMIRDMARKGVIGLTLDGVPRISRAQKMDALTSMSTCAGYKGILLAANALTKFMPQMFTAVGMIKPCQVMVLGTGVAGLQALATAKRLGAVTHAVDIRPDAAEQATSLGAKVVASGVDAEVAVGAGGYARHLPEEWLRREREAIREAVAKMDIVFCSALVPSRQAPMLLTADMVASMAPGSVIMDISIDQGGNCELTEPGEICQKHGVTIFGIKNIPGMLPTSSTEMFAKNMQQLVKYLVRDGKLTLDRSDEIVAGILTTIDGEVVHEGALEAMGGKK